MPHPRLPPTLHHLLPHPHLPTHILHRVIPKRNHPVPLALLARWLSTLEHLHLEHVESVVEEAVVGARFAFQV